VACTVAAADAVPVGDAAGVDAAGVLEGDDEGVLLLLHALAIKRSTGASMMSFAVRMR
jgi:hypothetical protein